MRNHRFFAPLDLAIGQHLVLPKEASHHCIQVLRYQVGSELTLFNGDGFDYVAKIKDIDGKRCEVGLLEQVNPNNESTLNIHLFQGIARGEKMDLIIQKSVELGVKEITPLFTERCNVKLEGKRLIKKQEHWQKISISACEQSGRAFIPKINKALNIKELSVDNNYPGFYLQPTAEQRLLDNHMESKISLYIGPEGGFSDADVQLLHNFGIAGVKLGPRILRTETAGLACIAVLQSHVGDL